MADEYTGAPGFSAPLWETDFAFRKPRCDVVLNGAAYAPGGRPAERVRVGLKVGAWSKVFDVFGHREWRARGPLFAATAPEPFLRQPFSYDVAWGGTDRLDPDDPLPGGYPRNPVGTGWAQPKHQRLIPGLAPADDPGGRRGDRPRPSATTRPMSFGPMGRGWPGRIEFGGTYDQNWIDNVFPFLPRRLRRPLLPDGPARPADRPAPRRRGGHARQPHPAGQRELPPARRPRLPLTLFKGRAIAFEAPLLPDTLLFDPENRRLSLVWRVSSRIHRTILDFTEAWVGPPTEADAPRPPRGPRLHPRRRHPRPRGRGRMTARARHRSRSAW